MTQEAREKQARDIQSSENFLMGCFGVIILLGCIGWIFICFVEGPTFFNLGVTLFMAIGAWATLSNMK
jgi:uncharacterized membrane protein